MKYVIHSRISQEIRLAILCLHKFKLTQMRRHRISTGFTTGISKPNKKECKMYMKVINYINYVSLLALIYFAASHQYRICVN